MERLLSIITLLGCAVACLAGEAVTARQANPGIANLLNIGSLTSIMSSIAPVLLMMGLGALFIPLLGSAFLFREGRSISFPKITPGFIDKVTDTLEKVARALEEVDKKY